MLEVGDEVHVNPPLRRGMGRVVYVKLPFVRWTPEQVKAFYEMDESDRHWKGTCNSRPKVSMVVVEREEGGFLILPMTVGNSKARLLTRGPDRSTAPKHVPFWLGLRGSVGGCD